LTGWGDSHLASDKEWLSEFLEEYPGLTPSHIRACRDFHSNKTKHNKALWKSRLRNWMRLERQRQGDKANPNWTNPNEVAYREIL
jgi:hypothetical protein